MKRLCRNRIRDVARTINNSPSYAPHVFKRRARIVPASGNFDIALTPPAFLPRRRLSSFAHNGQPRARASHYLDSSSASRLAPALPVAVFVWLPISGFKSGGFYLAAALPGGGHSVGILAVEYQHETLIGRGILRQRYAVDQKPDRGAIRIVVFHRQQNRLRGCLEVARRAVGQEAVVAIGP